MPRSLISKRVKISPVLFANTRYVYLWWWIEKAYNITSEEADMVVANAMPVKGSIKAIANNIPCLFILPNSLDIDLHILNLAKLYINEKTEKYLYRFIHSNYGAVLYLSTEYSDLNDVIMPVGYDGLKTAR